MLVVLMRWMESRLALVLPRVMELTRQAAGQFGGRARELQGCWGACTVHRSTLAARQGGISGQETLEVGRAVH